MFSQIRFQTGEVQEIIKEVKKGNIPCMDVDNWEDFEYFIDILAKHGIERVLDVPLDKNARDKVKEPEFEFRAAFTDKTADTQESPSAKQVFIDFYFEPEIEETYDSIMGD